MSCYSFSQPNTPFEPDETTLALWHLENSEPDFDAAILVNDDNPTWFSSAIRSHDGNFLAGGGVVIEGVPRFMIAKIRPNGNLIWSSNYGLEGAHRNFCKGIVEMEDGTIVAVGNAHPNPFSRGWMIILNESGELISSLNLFEISYSWYANTVLIDNTGDIVVGGKRLRRGLQSFQVAKYNIQGDPIWRYRNESLCCDKIIQASDSSYIAVGRTQNLYGEFGHITKLTPDGDDIWELQVSAFERRAGLTSVLEYEDGYLCLGYTAPPGINDVNTNIWLVTVDFDGIETNSVTVDSALFGRVKPTDIIRAHDGNFLISGFIWDNNNNTCNGIPLLKINGDLEIIYSESIFNIEYSMAASIIPNPDYTYTLFGGVNGWIGSVFEMGLLTKTSADFHWYKDFTGNGNKLHSAGIISHCDGIFGDALDLSNQSSGVAFISDNETLCPDQFRIEAWFQMDSTILHEGAIVSKLIEDNYSSFQLYADNNRGKVGFAITTESGDEYVEINTDLNDNEWHYIAGDFDGEQIRLIWDGDFVGSCEISNPINYGEGSFIVGGDADYAGSDLQFYGNIDEVMLSNAPFEQVNVQNKSGIKLPGDLSILDIYPNPFNNSVNIRYSVISPGNIEVTIYDYLGKEVKSLFNAQHASGLHQIDWKGISNTGLPTPSGVYFARLSSERQTTVSKMLLVR